MMKKSNRPETAATSADFRETVPLLLLVAFLAVLPVSAKQSPAVADAAVPDNIAPQPAPAQPLPFSHKTHLASGPACQMCHVNPDPGTQMTFPATATCMSCHATIAADKPAIKTVRDFSVVGIEIPWARVYAITPGVTWSHRAHLDAGTQCETCHGDISQTEAVAETKAIRAMASCISCHQAREAAAECVTCHAWPTDQLLGVE